MDEKHLIGIDFGTTNSCVCYTGYNPQLDRYVEPEPLRFEGCPTVRTALYLDEQGRVVTWGDAAYKNAAYAARPSGLREEFKLQVGGDADDVRGADPAVSREAEANAVCFFRQLTAALCQRFNVAALSAEDMAIFVGAPAGWSAQRAAVTRRIAEQAGLPGVIVLPEPVGALKYHHFSGDVVVDDPEDLTLVIDFGGGTTDFVVVRTEAETGLPQILSTYGERYGGKDFDRAIFDYILRSYWKREPPDANAQAQLLNFARQFKEFFSRKLAEGKTSVKQPCPLPGIQDVVSLTRADFESAEVCGKLIKQFFGIIFMGRGQSSADLAAVRRIILTGGSARWYFVRPALEELFPGCQIIISSNPEQAIAKGLALTPAIFPTRLPVMRRAVPLQSKPDGPGGGLEHGSAPEPPDKGWGRIREWRENLPVPWRPNKAEMVPAQPAPPSEVPVIHIRTLTAADLQACRTAAQAVILKYVSMAGGTAVVLSPLAGSSVALVGIEAKMVIDIAKAYGYELSLEQAAKVAGGLIAGGAVAKITATELLTLVPGPGWVLKGVIAAGYATALGKVTMCYFEGTLPWQRQTPGEELSER